MGSRAGAAPGLPCYRLLWTAGPLAALLLAAAPRRHDGCPPLLLLLVVAVGCLAAAHAGCCVGAAAAGLLAVAVERRGRRVRVCAGVVQGMSRGNTASYVAPSSALVAPAFTHMPRRHQQRMQHHLPSNLYVAHSGCDAG